MKVMGLRPWPYWFSTFCGDMLIGAIIFAVNSIPFLAIKTKLYERTGLTIELLLFAGLVFNTICMSYLYGFLFTKVNIATKAYPGVVFMSYGFPILYMLQFTSDEGVWNIFRWFGSIWGILIGPSFTYYTGVLRSMPDDIKKENPIWDIMLCNFKSAEFYVCWLFGYGLFCFLLSIYIESKRYALKP
mmetsp:Transcript_23331/g.20240  ORF Transcript_23331/g.20240 Transcript_23331/m.20240 type:complete len:187 (-) Transcript_23331:1011-1571(-)